MWKDKIFDKMMEELKATYDEKAHMLSKKLTTFHYHSKMIDTIAHPVYDSLCYACCLMDTGNAENIAQAVVIVKIVLKHQDKDEFSKTFGVYPYYIEEPVKAMEAVDMNMADFVTKELIYLILYHIEHFDCDTVQEILNCITRSCKCIMKKNVYYDYTNISLMSTYVLNVGGLIINDSQIYQFGKNKLRELYDYNAKCGNFVEYNSPTYTGIAIEEVSRMLRDFKDPGSIELAKKLNHMLWRTMAVHYHSKTKQWTGPHGRAYSDFTDRNLIFIKYATKGALDMISDDATLYDPSWNGVPFNCPEEFFEYFRGGVKQIEERCTYNADTECFYTQKAYSWIEQDYALGSFGFSDMWIQRHTVIGYFGDELNPCCIKLRFMHDNYDFSSATLNSVQDKGHVMGVINFCTDGGDTHMNLDTIKDGKVMANDFRLSNDGFTIRHGYTCICTA